MRKNRQDRSKPRPNVSSNSSAGISIVGTGQPRLGDDEGAPVLHSHVLPPSPAQINPPSQTNPHLPPTRSNPILQPYLSGGDISLQPFLDGLHQLGLELIEQQLDQFLRYQQELLDWNTRMNLTSITNPEEVLIKHFLDSLSLLLAFDAPTARVLDIGAGAGFPGLPLKILRPQWHLVLLEATGKKVRFLQHIIEALQLYDVEAVNGRAEELARKAEYRATFDLVTARAVAALPMLLEYAAPFCALGGKMIFPKKGDIAEELARGRRAASQVGARFKADIPITLPGLDDGRRLLIWEQVSKCPG